MRGPANQPMKRTGLRPPLIARYVGQATMQVRKPHRLNVVGDFYVENGCCTACGVPELEAPALFAWDQEHQCYVSKQPSNPDEVRGMLNAIACADLRCIRYRGRDPALLKALVDMGEVGQCDHPGPRFLLHRLVARLRSR
jgi:hypothetical protein